MKGHDQKLRDMLRGGKEGASVLFNIRTMLANLIGEEDRTLELGTKKYGYMEPRHLEGLPFEQAVLEAIYRCSDTGIPPTYEHVYGIVSSRKGLHGDIHEQFDRLVKCATPQRNVTGYVVGFQHWLGSTLMADKLREMADIAEIMADDVAAFNLIVGEIMKLAPTSTEGGFWTDLEMYDAFITDLERRKERVLAGQATGPTFPWPSLQAIIPIIEKGQQVVFVGKSGTGKTMLALKMAHSFAYKQAGYDCLYLFLETDPITVERRNIVRETHIPNHVLRTLDIYDNVADRYTLFDVEDKRFKQRLTDYQDFIRERRDSHGSLHFAHMPGATLGQIDVTIRRAKILAESKGRELVVVLDYYTEIDHGNGMLDEAKKNNELAYLLKNMAERLGIYLVSFAQNNMHAKGGEEVPFNGQRITQKSQAMIFWEIEHNKQGSPLAEETLPVLDGNGKIMTDAVGREMFYHKKGELTSYYNMRVSKVNEGEKGAVIPMQVLFPYFDVVERE